MGRNMVLNRFVEALPEIYLGHGAVRENWMPVDEALARWEDDGGRVSDQPRSPASWLMPGAAGNRAIKATA